ncbi:PREDICTED: prostaglandin E2 receptor EP4 subtype-like [Nipponia nippon]|uniref:prostaglandin E2 receptor EP4 subtype-like n=1 Tax=Nipponia nippon TaxID=128390 RepID=UPI000511683E|nr:PREDICTED: prostaglandin E2 receptor EP4 subtype-like [Nipponia nippon]
MLNKYEPLTTPQKKEKKKIKYFNLVCGLAVTDLLGTCLVSPVTIATYLQNRWPGGPALCEYSSFILLFFGLSGLSIICAMSIERYLAINHAYFYNHYVDKKLAGLTLFAIYASNVLFCALPSMGLGKSTLQYPHTWCFIDWHAKEATHAAYSYMYAGFSSFLIMVTVICNILVCVALIRMHRQFMRRMSLGTDTTSSRLSDFRRRRSFRRMAGAEIQMVILLIATSLVVVICSIPLVGTAVLDVHAEGGESSVHLAPATQRVLHTQNLSRASPPEGFTHHLWVDPTLLHTSSSFPTVGGVNSVERPISVILS